MTISRRKLITGGLVAAAGAGGIAVAGRNGLIPPNYGGIYGLGETLTYASHRLLTRHSMAREFSRSQISKEPFQNGKPPEREDYLQLKAGGFADWRVTVDGLVAKPTSFSLADIKGFPTRSQITHLACEEGWSFIAEWIGTPLSHVLELAGILPQARYVVYSSIQPGWQDGIDMADALHPQTILTYAMNDDDLPLGHGGPLRLRVPRQLGYKSVKYITGLTVTDTLQGYYEGGDYSWYAGI